MLIACSLRSFVPHALPASLAAIREAGVGSVELSAVASPTESWLELVEGSETHLRALLAEHQLQAAALDMASIDLGHSQWPELCRSACSLATGLGAPVLIASAGDDFGIPARRQSLLMALRQLADLAQNAGLTVALDIRPGLCGDGRAMCQTMQDAAHDALRLNFATGEFLRLNPHSSWDVSLARACGWLGSLRLQDYSLGGDADEFPPLGQGGDIDLARVLQIIQSVGFRGPCTIDFRRTARKKPLSLEETRRWLLASVAHLRWCGWFDDGEA